MSFWLSMLLNGLRFMSRDGQNHLRTRNRVWNLSFDHNYCVKETLISSLKPVTKCPFSWKWRRHMHTKNHESHHIYIFSSHIHGCNTDVLVKNMRTSGVMNTKY